MRDQYTGSAFPFQMHQKIFERIAKRTKGYKYYDAMKFSYYFAEFLINNGYDINDSGKPRKKPDTRDKIYLNVAGKNFGSFDLPYLNEKTDLGKFVRIRHTILDVGPLYAEVGDHSVPGLGECLRRAGLESRVAHTAVEDSLDVVRLVRHKFLGDSHGNV